MLQYVPFIALLTTGATILFHLIHNRLIEKLKHEAAEKVLQLQRTMEIKQMQYKEVSESLRQRDQEYLLNLYRCYCGDMLRREALFCHKCGRRKGT